MKFWNWLKNIFKKKNNVASLPFNDIHKKIIDIAYKEMGQKEIAGSKHNPRILEYHATTTGKFTTDEIPWCSSFVCWVLQQAGVAHTRNALAASYKTWGVGKSLQEIRRGHVAVLRRGVRKHHVAFVWDYNPETRVLTVLGGNQSNAVNLKQYSLDKLLALRGVN